jgi:DNA-binding beta-propeller fold protein YncE
MSPIAIAPDGRNAYVVSVSGQTGGIDAVVVLSRDAKTGALTQLAGETACVSEDARDGCAQGRGLRGARALAISPDGRSVYVASGNGVAVFARLSDGELTQSPSSEGCLNDTGNE